ncbi:DUF4214 domain-containing protein, partial [Serratia ureilytica]
GTTKDANAINYWGSHINNGSLSALTAAQVSISDRSYISSLSDADFVARLFQFGYERAPTSAESATYLAELSGGTSRAQVVLNIINTLKGTVAAGDLVAQQH